MRTGEKFFHLMILFLPLILVVVAQEAIPEYFFAFFGMILGFCVLVFFGLLAIGSENPTPTGAFFRRFAASFGASILIFIWPIFLGWKTILGIPAFAFLPIPVMLVVTVVLPCAWYALTGFPPPWLRPRKRPQQQQQVQTVQQGGQVRVVRQTAMPQVNQAPSAQAPQAASQKAVIQPTQAAPTEAKAKPQSVNPKPAQAPPKPKKPSTTESSSKTSWSPEQPKKPKPSNDGDAPSPDLGM